MIIYELDQKCRTRPCGVWSIVTPVASEIEKYHIYVNPGDSKRIGVFIKLRYDVHRDNQKRDESSAV